LIKNIGGDRNKLIEITRWGNLSLGDSGRYFYGCNNLNITAEDILNMDGTTNMDLAFEYCYDIEIVPNYGICQK